MKSHLGARTYKHGGLTCEKLVIEQASWQQYGLYVLLSAIQAGGLDSERHAMSSRLFMCKRLAFK